MCAVIGCSSDPGQRPQPVDVTATVIGVDGNPLPKTAVVILQPTGDQLPSKLVSEGKDFTAKAMPGVYMYYIASAKGVDGPPPAGVPAKYTTASKENTVEVVAGKPIEIKLSN
jgi:hypothetical protein